MAKYVENQDQSIQAHQLNHKYCLSIQELDLHRLRLLILIINN